MEENINKGDAEPAPTSSEGQTELYLPHHCTYHTLQNSMGFLETRLY